MLIKYCHICNGKFEDLYSKKYRKVRVHCHYTDKYRGVAYSECNVRYKIPKEVSIVYHNVSKYQYHFIIKWLAGRTNWVS